MTIVIIELFRLLGTATVTEIKDGVTAGIVTAETVTEGIVTEESVTEIGIAETARTIVMTVIMIAMMTV